ncbi:CBS domain-containing protein [Methanosarcinaceae archaeon]|nr:CBS domain-containing protein [Methanosarcinaceae archaeon]MBQ3621167.1 CBS domain-containing protein [Methanosarcinaceae archaeon]
MQVRDIMVDAPTISKADKISHALEIMDKKKTRRLLVLNNGAVAGILTMRSLAKELGTQRTKPASSLPVVTAVTDSYTFIEPTEDFTDAVKLLKEKGGVLLVSRNEEDVMGWITPMEILSNYKFEGTAKDVMSTTPISIHPTDRLVHARRLMIENNIGRLPVIEGGKVVGVISEKDVAIAFQEFKDSVPDKYQDARLKEIVISDIMKTNPITAAPDTPLSEIADIVINKDVGIIPIIDNGSLVGIVTRRRLIKSIKTE